MKSAIFKRSIELKGHKTSVSLEDGFWDGLRKIAQTRQIAMPDLLAEIDAGRGTGNLSSAIRVFVLDFYRTEASKRAAEQPAAMTPVKPEEPARPSPIFPPPRVSFRG
jgi:predicted DNA-binding ribbon-helix-helix protein